MIHQILSISKKIKQFHHDHGLKALMLKLRMQSFLITKAWVNKNIWKQIKVQDVLNQAWPHAMPIDSLKIERTTPRLNIVLDDLANGYIAPLMTATLFANKQNIPLRIISRAKETEPHYYFNILKVHNIPAPKKVEFFSDYDRALSWKRARLETSDQDIYMATSWWSSEAIQSVNLRPSFFHFILEPCSSYRHKNALKNPKGRFINNLAFHKPSPDAFQMKQKYTLFLPDLAGLKLLDEALTRGVLNAKEWDIYISGEHKPPLVFSIGVKPKFLGKMTYEDYLNFIKTVDLAICTDSSIANDVLASGGVVLSIDEEDELKEAIQLAKDPIRRSKRYKENNLEETLQYMDENK